MATILLYLYLSSAAMFINPGEPAESAPTAAAVFEARNQEQIADRFGTLFTTLASRHGFNGNVLLSHNGKIVYKNAFGYSDMKLKTPLNIESVFQLASVSKQFTSVAIMILHDQGKLEFTDPVDKYFPDFPYKDVTIRHLLRHRSGIPDYMNFAGRYWKHKNEPLTNAALMEMLVTYHPRSEFKVDQRYKYSNTGYAILASLIEKISGQSYGDFMKEHVFSLVGMHNTFVFDPNNRQTMPFETKGYNKNRAPAYEDFLSGVVGDKGIYSTVDDMFKWDQGLYTESLVKHVTLDEAFTPPGGGYNKESGYGYGFRIETMDNGEKIIYHAGWWRGYISLYVRRLDDKTSIIVLSNKVNWCFRNIERLLDTVDAKNYGSIAQGGE